MNEPEILTQHAHIARCAAFVFCGGFLLFYKYLSLQVEPSEGAVSGYQLCIEYGE